MVSPRDAGETIGIVGPEGAGKSTLMSLVTGFYQSDAGQIMLDGHHITVIDLLSQETILFEGILRENIAYGLSERVACCPR